MYQKRINKRTTKSTIFFGLLGMIFISFALILFMVDLTSKIKGPGIHGHKKKSALSLFTEGNNSIIRSMIGQLSFYQAKAYDIKSAFPTRQCSRPQQINNSSASRMKTDMTSITLDELSWETFGDNMPTIGKLAHLSNRLSQEVNKTAVLAERNQTVDEVFHELGLLVDVDGYLYLPGGHWRPLKCAPKWKVAIVVPFRDRVEHLAIFLRHMIPLLQRQKLEFSFFIVEQNNNMSFNRAMLLNVGFLEALKLTRYDCFIFHDVDHLPINANNYYGCEYMPRHFISGDDLWGYTLLYADLFGGVTGLTTEQMHIVNGFSNVYWGWGGEDDDIYKRIAAHGYIRTRPPGSVGYYNTIAHQHAKKEENKERLCHLNFATERMGSDGLNNIQYPEPEVDLTPLFTKISVDIRELPWKDQWTDCSPLMDLFKLPEGLDDDAGGDVPGPVNTAVERRNRPYPYQPEAPANPVALKDPAFRADPAFADVPRRIDTAVEPKNQPVPVQPIADAAPQGPEVPKAPEALKVPVTHAVADVRSPIETALGPKNQVFPDHPAPKAQAAEAPAAPAVPAFLTAHHAMRILETVVEERDQPWKLQPVAKAQAPEDPELPVVPLVADVSRPVETVVEERNQPFPDQPAAPPAPATAAAPAVADVLAVHGQPIGPFMVAGLERREAMVRRRKRRDRRIYKKKKRI